MWRKKRDVIKRDLGNVIQLHATKSWEIMFRSIPSGENVQKLTAATSIHYNILMYP